MARSGEAGMRRREVIGLIGGAAAVLPTRGLGQPLPVIGFLSSLSERQTVHLIDALQHGLGEAGFVDSKTVRTESRFADGQYDRLASFANEFVHRPVSLIVAAGPPAALAAKAATGAIPIVFVVGFDPVSDGLVASFNRPGGNATGIFLITALLGQKRLELLRELNPQAATIAILVNPASPDAPPEIRDVEAAADAYKIRLRKFNATSPSEIDAGFEAIAAEKPDGFLCGSDPFFCRAARADRGVCSPPANPSGLPVPRISCRGWAAQLRYEPSAGLSASRHLRRSNSEGCKTG
jgi:putative tryptophan/tyrosine transport system substrate-binding protein